MPKITIKNGKKLLELKDITKILKRCQGELGLVKIYFNPHLKVPLMISSSRKLRQRSYFQHCLSPILHKSN